MEIDPDNKSLTHIINYFNRGFSKNQLKDYSGAIADYTKAIEIDPNYALAYGYRGYSKSVQKDYNGAIADYSKVIEIDTNNAVAYDSRARLKEITGLPYCSDYKKACDLGEEKACERYKLCNLEEKARIIKELNKIMK